MRSLLLLSVIVALGGCSRRPAQQPGSAGDCGEFQRRASNFWTPEQRSRLGETIRAASPAFNTSDAERIVARVDAWHAHWVDAQASQCNAAKSGELEQAKFEAQRACRDVDFVAYTTQVAQLDLECRAKSCLAERVSELDSSFATAELRLSACAAEPTYRSYLATDLATPASVQTQGRLLGYSELGAYESRNSLLATALGTSSGADDSRLRIRLLSWEARRLDAAGEPEKALATLNNAIERSKRLKESVGWLLRERARVFANLGEPEANLADLRAALREAQRLEGPQSYDTATAEVDLGIALAALDRDQESRDVFSRAEAAFAALGADIPRADVHGWLAMRAIALANYAGAEDWLRRAEVLQRRQFGERHLEFANLLINRAMVPLRTGAPDEATRYLLRALRIRESVLGPEHVKVASAEFYLGASRREAEDYQGAVRWFRKAQKVRAHLSEHDDLSDGMLWDEIGFALWGEGDLSAALDSYAQALTLYRRALGESSDKVAEAYGWIGLIHLDREAWNDAQTAFETQLKINTELHGAKYKVNSDTYTNLGKALSGRGDFAGAMTWYGKALDLSISAWGADTEQTGNILDLIAETFRDLETPSAALSYALRAQAVWTKIRPEHHVDRVNACQRLGYIQQKLGHPAEAFKAFQCSVAGYRSLEDREGFDDAVTAISKLCAEKYTPACAYRAPAPPE